MSDDKSKKLVFISILSILALIGAYVLSGALVLILNKVGFFKFFELWHFNFIFEALSKNYPKTWQSIGLASFICLFGVLCLVLLILFKNKESLFGEARFANFSEIRKMGLFGDKNNFVKRGIIIGKYGKKFLQFGGQQFVALGAPTRSGKGVGIVIPNLLHWQESAVVQDIKQECFDYTSKYRAEKLGNKVFLFNPFSTRTHRYNPFTYIDMADSENADSQLMDLANIIYPLGNDDTSKFFSQQAQNLFIGLCYLYKDLTMSEKGELFLEAYGLEVEFNFYGILQLSKGFEIIDPHTNNKLAVGFEETYKLLDEIKILGEITKRRISTYIQIDSANTKSGVMSSFNAPLSPFEGETLRLATQTSDFDLRNLRKEKMTIYIGITPDQLNNARFILNIFWSQLILLNTKELPQQNDALKYACLLVMDEFTAPGQIQIYQTSVSFIAGYNLRSLMIYQSKSQLRTPPPLGYGNEGAETLLTNHACQIFYAPREEKDAEELSKTLGNKTVSQTSRSINQGANGGGSTSTSQTHRALMLPQELREMPFEKELITIDSGKPIFCNKAFYYNDSYFMDKFKAVSPSLAKIKGIPNRKELENAILSGECNVLIPIHKSNLKGEKNVS
ncbi:sodium:calcium antiporter [Campylobacter sp. MIT 12-8780]|uniref:type IV secretory system conjugative DNA transfer family protein n=1 Tax=unclassified Campylobacter TaxID=2593542 RepID=UPI00115C7460|nr:MULTISPECIES: type IV secretory system conjugative DNA transfer family protein [unclassified Campylobacter]NDJ28063.1 type IV secretory system conjugative DNA transfer family protein [Campylobacter sp. MIT 19-121]TQR39971.1 sodium:calcium antiporter [Campylobacter sp. MIT 12-8780]